MALEEVAGRVGTRTGALDGRVVAPFQRGIHADHWVRWAGADDWLDARNLIRVAGDRP
jgi:hypothetical protein